MRVFDMNSLVPIQPSIHLLFKRVSPEVYSFIKPGVNSEAMSWNVLVGALPDDAAVRSRDIFGFCAIGSIEEKRELNICDMRTGKSRVHRNDPSF